MTKDFATVRGDMPVSELVEKFTRTGHHGFPVVDESRNLIGIVTLSDIEEAVVDEEKDLLVEDIMTRSPLTVYPDETLEDALRGFGARDVGRLPVVDRADPRKILGLLRRGDIISAYSRTSLEHAEVLTRIERMKVETGPGIKFVEADVSPGSQFADKRIQELTLPRECILVSIRRAGRVLIPHGNTVLEPGDKVLALAKRSDERELLKAFGQ